MSVRTSGKKKKRPPTPPERCPKCGTTKNLTVTVKNVPDGRFLIGGRVVWDNNSPAKCAECGFTGKVADFF